MSEAREMWEAPRYKNQPVKCPECGKLFSKNRIDFHRETAHNIY